MAKSIANYRQKPEAKWMNRKAVGIDVSNGHSTVMVLAPEGKVIVKPFEIRHTVHGFIDLTKRLTQMSAQ